MLKVIIPLPLIKTKAFTTNSHFFNRKKWTETAELSSERAERLHEHSSDISNSHLLEELSGKVSFQFSIFSIILSIGSQEEIVVTELII